MSDIEERSNEIIDRIKDDHGEGSIGKLTDSANFEIDTISTGSLSLDIATGIGGIPKGKNIEIFGKESTGKSTLSLSIVSEAHKDKDSLAGFIDVEHALSPQYAKNLGVDLDRFLFSQPNSGEEALSIVEELMGYDEVDVIVIDSVASLLPSAEKEGEIGDSQIGLQARLVSQGLRKMSIGKGNASVIFINQIRQKINTSPWGPSQTTPGGNALDHHTDMRIKLYVSSRLGKDNTIGHTTTAKIVKNKDAPPYKEGKFDLIYGEGISKEREVINLGVEYDIIERNGAWYSYNDNNIGQGKQNSVEYLKKHPDLENEIRELILEKVGMKNN
ncbi:MAG: recombinase RecA [Promethearchaeota archaeon]